MYSNVHRDTERGSHLFPFQAPINILFECTQSTPQLWFSLMHLISLFYWNEGKNTARENICMSLKNKRRAPFNLRHKNLRNLSMLMESNDCIGLSFFLLVNIQNILTEMEINEIWMYFWVTRPAQPKPLISFSYTELHDTHSTRNMQRASVYLLRCNIR